MSNKIKITTVTGGKDKDMLKGCYFLPSTTVSDAYDFYDTNNNLLESNITGTSFDFPLGVYEWEIENLVISTTAASGDWSNNNPNPTGEEDGTFQAQAGGGIDPDQDEDAAAASA